MSVNGLGDSKPSELMENMLALLGSGDTLFMFVQLFPPQLRHRYARLLPAPNVAFHLAPFRQGETPGPTPADSHRRRWQGGAVIREGRQFRPLLSGGFRRTVLPASSADTLVGSDGWKQQGHSHLDLLHMVCDCFNGWQFGPMPLTLANVWLWVMCTSGSWVSFLH